MQITTNTVVSIHYKLTDTSGKVIDSSDGREPLAYLHGRGNIIPGLEKELEGKKTGAKLSVTVQPEEAYGQHDQNLIRQVSREAFKGIDDLQVGMQFQSQSEKGIEVFTVTEIEGEKITIDGNHSLAGMTLSFEVEVTDVREATEEELSHGHVHGPGGHQH